MTFPTIDNIVAVLGLLGIGTIIGNYVRILLERKNQAQLQKQEFKEARYKCIILLMYASLDFEKEIHNLRKHGRNFASYEELMEELKTEWYNMILFASDEVLRTTHAFILKPSVSLFKNTVLAMRKDLWGGKLSEYLVDLSF
jgi:hypothetical protein